MLANKSDERVIIIAPLGQDASAIASLLQQQGIDNITCDAPTEACRQLIAGCAVLLLTEEALELPQISDLLHQLESQPPWSELPVIILARSGESHLAKLLDLLAGAARSVTLLERPLSAATLLRSVDVALRSRRRQFQVRDLLEQEKRKQQELIETQETLKKAQLELRKHATTLEKAVAERTHDLRATNEQLEAFVYSIAHDLRAPLRSMIGYSHLLMDDYAPSLEETAQTLLKRIQASSEFMDKLLLDLLAYGRTARAEIPLAPVEIRKAWEIALFQCATQIEQTSARVETIEPLAAVLAHEATLGQCLANLLSNALKFVAPNVQPEVRCRAEMNGDRIRVWVEDNGLGIPANQHERAFRVFERLHGSRYVGTGIGLSIVRKGVERMGGNVGLESEPGKGSRFWIELAKANSRYVSPI
jgi:signal transduction histidine kinase